MASSLTRNQVPRKGLGVRIPCPPLELRCFADYFASALLHLLAGRRGVSITCHLPPPKQHRRLIRRCCRHKTSSSFRRFGGALADAARRASPALPISAECPPQIVGARVLADDFPIPFAFVDHDGGLFFDGGDPLPDFAAAAVHGAAVNVEEFEYVSVPLAFSRQSAGFSWFATFSMIPMMHCVRQFHLANTLDATMRIATHGSSNMPLSVRKIVSASLTIWPFSLHSTDRSPR